MPLARADLLAILNWIAAERHSRAVSVPVVALILAEALLDLFYYYIFGEEFVGPALDVPL
jgi:uncharacterized Rmd1/YagE family protein